MKKLINIAAALVLLLALSACGSSGSSATNPNLTVSQANARIPASDSDIQVGSFPTVNEGKLTAAVSPDASSGGLGGVDGELLELLAKELELELQLEPMDFESAILAIQNGECDLMASGVTVQSDLMPYMDFTDAYTTAALSVVVRTGGDVTTSALDGRSIGAVEGVSDYYDCVREYGVGSVTGYDTYEALAQAVLDGAVDCAVMGVDHAQSIVADFSGLTVLDEPLAERALVYGVTKGNQKLLDALNSALAGLVKDGSVRQIVDQYLNG